MEPTNNYEQEPVYNLPDRDGEALEPGQLKEISDDYYDISELIGEYWD